MPFPSHQGTQALLREQCLELAGRGHEVHLLVYAHGGWEERWPFTVHRLSDWPRERSLRSGPSWRKAALDLRLAAVVRRLARTVRPDLVHAHNYEALVACVLARPRQPLIYHAHTLFERELPSFVRSGLAQAAAGVVGGLMDRLVPPRATATLAVSPRLVDELCRRRHPADRIVCSLPGIAPPLARGDRDEVRAELGLGGVEVVGYCGNLDGYQDIPTMLSALAELSRRRPAVRLLVITSSSRGELVEAARGMGVAERLLVVAHGSFDEAFRRMAAIDVCLVPRSTPGGFPIKLLAYLAAGRPVVSTRVGVAGLELGEAVSVVAEGDGRAMAEALSWWLDRPDVAQRRGAVGRRLALDVFSWERRGAELEGQLARWVTTRND